MTPTLPSLVAPEVVIMTTTGATSGDKVGINAVLAIRWRVEASQWRHNEPRGVSNHRHLDCMLSLYGRTLKKNSELHVTGLCERNPPITGGFPSKRTNKGAVTCAVCPESAWLVTFLIDNVSTGVVTWSALRCGASGESGKKVAAAPLSKTAAGAAAAKTWFAKHPVDYMLHNRFPWKRSGRRSSMWPPYFLRRNLSAAACRPCDRSFQRKMFTSDDVITAKL